MSERGGTIGGEAARVRRAPDGRLLLEWRGREHDLATAVLRHRDDGGLIAFAAGGDRAEYARPARDPAWVDEVGEDEPWTWEDGDFGLFAFHVATRTGPLKHRDGLLAAPAAPPPGHRGIEIAEERLTRRLPGVREEAVRLDRLVEVRAKFELGGIWSDPALLVLDDGDGVAVVPVGSAADAAFARDALLPRLRRLPGWEDAPFDAALAYALRAPARGPRPHERPEDWAERPVWPL